MFSDPSQSTTTLVISSLPPNYTSDSLSTLLSSLGPIRTAFVVTSSSSQANRTKGYGFAKFVLKDDAERAITELGGTYIDGRRITVQWAKRRLRGDSRTNRSLTAAANTVATSSRLSVGDDESDEDFSASRVEEAVPMETLPMTKSVRNAYAVRREAKKAARMAQTNGDGTSASVYAVNNARDSRTILIQGGLDYTLPEHKKALQNRLKKLILGINTGYGALNISEIVISNGPASTSTERYQDDQSTRIKDPDPLVYLECPSAKVASELEGKIHNTILKGTLVRAKNKFENDLVVRKGREKGGGRLIVRNLGFDVRLETSVSCFKS